MIILMSTLGAGTGSFEFALDLIYCFFSEITHADMKFAHSLCQKDSSCTGSFSYSKVPFLFHSAEIRMCFWDNYSTLFGWDFCLWWDPDVPCPQLLVCFPYLGNLSVLLFICNIYLAFSQKERSVQPLSTGQARRPDPDSGPSPLASPAQEALLAAERVWHSSQCCGNTQELPPRQRTNLE